MENRELRKEEPRELRTSNDFYEDRDIADLRVDMTPLDVPDEVKKLLKRRGLVYRWIRIAVRGNETESASYVAARKRQGWEFLRPEKFPFWEAPPQATSKSYGNIISVGDVALMINSERNVNKLIEMVNEKTSNLERGIANQLGKLQDKRMPIIDESHSTVTTGGGGRKVKFEED